MPEAATDRDRLAEIDPALGRGARLPLVVVLVGVVLAVALVPLGGFSLFAVREMKDALVAAEQERELRLADSVARQLDDFLEHAGREAHKIGQVTAGSAGTDLSALLDGDVVVARQVAGGAAESAVRPDFVMPHALAQALADAAQALSDPSGSSPSSPLVSGPFTVGPDRQIAVAVSAAVERQGATALVFQQVVLLQSAWERALRAVPAPNRLFLLRGDGSAVAGSPGMVDLDGAALRDRDIVRQFLAARGRSRGSRSYLVSDRGGARRVMGSFTATGHGWGVFVEVDEDTALAPVARLTRLVTLGGALAASLALAAALLLAALISRPVARLAHISKRLADGDFSVLAQPSPVHELDSLGVNFNRMAGRLGALVERFRTGAREANDMFLGTIRALAEAIDEKDPYTKGHSVRVNRYAVIVGRYLGLSREEMRHLQIASLLHDVGKIGIDDAILKKPAALSNEEFAVMKTHPERGAKIMGRIPQLRNMLAGMRFHHERWAGGGYPVGLTGEEIPLQARIIAVADTFDAMITERPYQKALPVAAAVARINDLRGTYLDPQVVAAFNRAYEAGEFDERPGPDGLEPARAAGLGQGVHEAAAEPAPEPVGAGDVTRRP